MNTKEKKALEALRRIHELLADRHEDIDYFSNRKDFRTAATLSTELLEDILNVALPVDQELNSIRSRLNGKMFGVEYVGSAPKRRNK